MLQHFLCAVGGPGLLLKVSPDLRQRPTPSDDTQRQGVPSCQHRQLLAQGRLHGTWPPPAPGWPRQSADAHGTDCTGPAPQQHALGGAGGRQNLGGAAAHGAEGYAVADVEQAARPGPAFQEQGRARRRRRAGSCEQRSNADAQQGRQGCRGAHARAREHAQPAARAAPRHGREGVAAARANLQLHRLLDRVRPRLGFGGALLAVLALPRRGARRPRRRRPLHFHALVVPAHDWARLGHGADLAELRIGREKRTGRESQVQKRFKRHKSSSSFFLWGFKSGT